LFGAEPLAGNPDKESPGWQFWSLKSRRDGRKEKGLPTFPCFGRRCKVAEGKGGDGADLMPPEFLKDRRDRLEEDFLDQVASGDAHPDDFDEWLVEHPVIPRPSPN
jgi:hypothetical protein